MPETIVTNTDLSKYIDTNDEWIKDRSGIAERRISVKETTSEMAVYAAQRAIKDAGIDPKEIDIIILATSSPDKTFPATAMDVHAGVGAVNAMGFDISAACTGFIYGLHIMQGFVASGMYKTGLIVGVETLSKVVDWSDRSSCFLFGDGAGAAVVRADEMGIRHAVMGSDGTKAWVLDCIGRSLGNCVTGTQPEMGFMKMDGQEVFKFAVKKVPEVVQQILDESGTQKEDIKYFLLHQANYRILEAASRRLKVSMDKIPVNIDRYGNTSAASIPILIDELAKAGKLNRGDKLLLAGFGAGLTWGGLLLEW